MAITPNQYPLLIAAPMLQDYLVDKDTGTPLAGGIVTFYHDNARTFLKNVYYQTGTPGNYSYIPLPNPLTLTSVGTIADNGGNDVIPFYFPYDEADDTVADPYYVTVYSSIIPSVPAVLQWTRENFPFVNATMSPNTTQETLLNLIPNGQFTSHNNLPKNGLFPDGNSSVTVAQGGAIGWYYTKNNTSTDMDFVTFTQLLQEPENLTGNPRFAIDLSCTSASGNDTFKELRMRFNNVNRFASTTQFYTFSFSGKSNASTPVSVFLKIIKYFGTGGSSTQQTVIQGFSLVSNLYNIFSTSFVFGVNSAATIGTLNDDYVELSIVLPATSTFNLNMTDFLLTPGFVNVLSYPERPDNMVFANSISGSVPTPNPNGSSLYLPITLTQGGAIFDASAIGDIVANATPFFNGNKLPCDGSFYLTAGYSALGIPYSRLQAVLSSNSLSTGGIPLYGTGSGYATAYINNSINNYIRLTTNQPGAQATATDGIIPTGFTFSNIHTGQTTGTSAYSNGPNSVLFIAGATGAVTNATAGTTTFTVTQLVNNMLSYAVFTVITVAASSITGGNYFTFTTPTTSYYCWFTVNGVGSDPAPGGTGIQVNLISTYTAQEVSNCVQEAVSGFQVSLIQTTAASAITNGSYFNFASSGSTFSPWYNIGGTGLLPAVTQPITVNLAGTETAAQVATLTMQAINSVYFAVPDFRGLFLRGIRGSGQFDVNAASRYSNLTGFYGNNPGTFELDTFQSHNHAATFANYSLTGVGKYIEFVFGTAAAGTINASGFSINNTGSAETQPVNAGVYYFIKY